MNIEMPKDLIDTTYAMISVFIHQARENLIPVLKEILPEDHSLLKEVEGILFEGVNLYQPYTIYLSLQKHPEASIVLNNANFSRDIYTYQRLVSYKDKISSILKRVQNIQELKASVQKES